VIWTVQFTSLAEADVAEAYDWYASSRRGLGEEFLADMDSVIQMVEQMPEVCPTVYRELRRALLHRFPYSIYYRLLPSVATIEVRGCVHQRRHPRTWRRRA
jgi:plasmid stabilization system protein ParE